MCYYRSVVDPAEDIGYRVRVLWDYPERGTAIGETTISDTTPDAIDAALATLGFRIAGRDGPALRPGERIVIRDSPHTFYNPTTRTWHACDTSCPPSTRRTARSH